MSRKIKEIRHSVKLTQKEFADKFDIPLSTLKKWEQGETSPAPYLIKMIESSLPTSNKNIITYIGRDNEPYYIDKDNKKIGDKYGNWVSFKEEIDGVIESNIPFYAAKFFRQFYQITDTLNEDLYYDKIEKVHWE